MRHKHDQTMPFTVRYVFNKMAVTLMKLGDESDLQQDNALGPAALMLVPDCFSESAV